MSNGNNPKSTTSALTDPKIPKIAPKHTNRLLLLDVSSSSSLEE
jgi:hypothetical protein